MEHVFKLHVMLLKKDFLNTFAFKNIAFIDIFQHLATSKK